MIAHTSLQQNGRKILNFSKAFDILIAKLNRLNVFSGDKVKEALDLVEEACWKADKYNWHDLREHPGDLPKKMEYVLTEFDNGLFFVDMFPLSSRVVAWKYIEPRKAKEEEEYER